MEAATKNKRGRPRGVIGELARITAKQWEETDRTVKNRLFAAECIKLDEAILKPFFVTSAGRLRRQGIAEQIGRMKIYGTATDGELLELAKDCIYQYNAGETVRTIETRLRKAREIIERRNLRNCYRTIYNMQTATKGDGKQ